MAYGFQVGTRPPGPLSLASASPSRTAFRPILAPWGAVHTNADHALRRTYGSRPASLPVRQRSSHRSTATLTIGRVSASRPSTLAARGQDEGAAPRALTDWLE